MKETEQFHYNRHHSKYTSLFRKSELGMNEITTFYLKRQRVVLQDT